MASVPTSSPNAPPPPPAWDAKPAGSTAGYGGFWIRVVAYIIDGILLSVAFWIIALIIGVNIIPADPAKLDPDALMGQMGSLQLIGVVVTWLYFALMESSPRGATLGKMAVGVRVVDEHGNRISFLRATGRFFAKYISAIILFIGFLMVAFTERKRGLHDIIAGTLVVKAR